MFNFIGHRSKTGAQYHAQLWCYFRFRVNIGRSFFDLVELVHGSKIEILKDECRAKLALRVLETSLLGLISSPKGKQFNLLLPVRYS